MREILFRGKRVDNGKWVEGDFTDQRFDEPSIWDDGYRIEIDLNTIGQYTGLKDKNGVKIFEGDKVRVFGGEERYGVHEYDSEGIIQWQGMGFDVVTDGVGQGFGYYGHDENIEIVGNIHEGV